ncbi:distal tail protein Dit [Alkalicoccobacillus porphyridii]|uniref:Siphovirus-type tail component RIFT-related domain-containing protein n=1 Tax=Alkalicoccobacillus porphyridii TaxID=2597270 RepID=A0A554A0A1_9BACI|nr:distal tail protein Dit [Alkalicoccobacillus porphyridii]TSB47122.1 hypothetical protein FN960_08900 [Alkalicoccobacillus porphyridii]
MITLDGHTAEELGLRIHAEFLEPALPSTNDVTVSIPGMHGAHYFGSDFQPREINIPISQTEQETRRDSYLTLKKLKKVLLDGTGRPKEVKLIILTQPDVYYKVRFHGSMSLQELFRFKRFELPLIAYDPHSYAVVKQDEVTWGSMDITFENTQFLMGHLGVSAQRIIENTTINYTVDGLNSSPLIRLSGTGENVRLSVNGKSLTIPNLTGTFNIDTSNYTVERNGENALHLMSGDFLAFVEGVNRLEISGSNMNFAFYTDIRNKYM